AARPIEERSSIHYNGEIEFRVELAPLKVDQQDLALTSSAAVVAGQTTADLDVIRFTGTLDRINIQSSLPDMPSAEPADLAIQGVSFKADYQRGKFGIYL